MDSSLELSEVMCIFEVDHCPGTGFLGSQAQAMLTYYNQERRFQAWLKLNIIAFHVDYHRIQN